MATENIIMEAVKAGGNRQELHEHIRTHSMEAARTIKADGAANDLLTRLAADPVFRDVAPRFGEILNPRAFIGRAPGQVEEYLKEEVLPALEQRKDLLVSENAEEVRV